MVRTADPTEEFADRAQKRACDHNGGAVASLGVGIEQFARPLLVLIVFDGERIVLQR